MLLLYFISLPLNSSDYIFPNVCFIRSILRDTSLCNFFYGVFFIMFPSALSVPVIIVFVLLRAVLIFFLCFHNFFSNKIDIV